MLDSLKFSKRQIRDTARLAIQAAVASALLFCAMEALNMPEKLLGIISAVFILSPGLGGTLFDAGKRFGAIMIGAAVGAACSYILPGGYGTALAIGLAMLVMNAIIGLFPMWRFAVVAAVALSLGAENDLLKASIDRILATGMGVVFGSAASFLIWPQPSLNRANEFLRASMCASRDLLSFSIRKTKEEFSIENESKMDCLKGRLTSLLEEARNAVANVRISDDTVIHDRLSSVTYIHNSLLMIDKIAEDENEIERTKGSFNDGVLEIQEEIREILSELVDEPNDLQDSRIDELTPKLERVRDLAANDVDKESWHHSRRVTLVYTLGKIVKDLSALRKTYDEKPV